MERTLEYIITDEFHNKTIEQFLKANEYPHQVLVQLKKTENGILLNGTVIIPKFNITDCTF